MSESHTTPLPITQRVDDIPRRRNEPMHGTTPHQKTIDEAPKPNNPCGWPDFRVDCLELAIHLPLQPVNPYTDRFQLPLFAVGSEPLRYPNLNERWALQTEGLS